MVRSGVRGGRSVRGGIHRGRGEGSGSVGQGVASWGSDSMGWGVAPWGEWLRGVGSGSVG